MNKDFLNVIKSNEVNELRNIYKQLNLLIKNQKIMTVDDLILFNEFKKKNKYSESKNILYKYNNNKDIFNEIEFEMILYFKKNIIPIFDQDILNKNRIAKIYWLKKSRKENVINNKKRKERLSIFKTINVNKKPNYLKISKKYLPLNSIESSIYYRFLINIRKGIRNINYDFNSELNLDLSLLLNEDYQ